jgi:hypothetical protein
VQTEGAERLARVALERPHPLQGHQSQGLAVEVVQPPLEGERPAAQAAVGMARVTLAHLVGVNLAQQILAVVEAADILLVRDQAAQALLSSNILVALPSPIQVVALPIQPQLLAALA